MNLPLLVAASVASAVLVLLPAPATAAPDLRLIEAARRADPQSIRALLKEGVDVNAPQGDGATALHWAVHLEDLATVDLLIRAGANVNAANDLGATPLYLACAHASAAMVERLLAAGANPNAPVTRTTSETPLMTAARVGAVEAVKALLARGANANAAERMHGQTALMWAAAHRHAKVVDALIKGGANVHARSRVDRMILLLAGMPENAQGISWDGGGFTPLLFAAREGDIESAKLLLDAGADVNEMTPDKTSALVIAAHSDHRPLVEYLLDRGADPSADSSGYTAMHAAVLRGDLPLVKTLLTRGVNPNARLKQGTPVNRASKDYALSTDWIGATPFWLAARFADVEIMRTLVAGGADPNVALPDGTTPLMVAAGLDFPGARADRRGIRREPGEFIAAVESGADEQQALAAVKMLLDLGADVSLANSAGNTVVHAAVGRKDTSVVQLLADHGARLDVKNKRGQTPLAIASTFTRTEADEGGIDTKMMELLRRLGATQ